MIPGAVENLDFDICEVGDPSDASTTVQLFPDSATSSARNVSVPVPLILKDSYTLTSHLIDRCVTIRAGTMSCVVEPC